MRIMSGLCGCTLTCTFMLLTRLTCIAMGAEANDSTGTRPTSATQPVASASRPAKWNLPGDRQAAHDLAEATRLAVNSRQEALTKAEEILQRPDISIGMKTCIRWNMASWYRNSLPREPAKAEELLRQTLAELQRLDPNAYREGPSALRTTRMQLAEAIADQGDRPEETRAYLEESLKDPDLDDIKRIDYLRRLAFLCINTGEEQRTLEALADLKALPVATDKQRFKQQYVDMVENRVKLDHIGEPIPPTRIVISPGSQPSLRQRLQDIESRWQDRVVARDALEKECLGLLEEYPAPADHGLIYASLAKRYRNGPWHREKVIEFAQKALECPQDVQTSICLHVFWGESLWPLPTSFGKTERPDPDARRQGATRFLKAMRIVLDNQTQRDIQKTPARGPFPAGVGWQTEEDRRNNSRLQEMQKVEQQNRLIRQRRALASYCGKLYAREPRDDAELLRLAQEILHDSEAVTDIMKALEAERSDQGKTKADAEGGPLFWFQ